MREYLWLFPNGFARYHMIFQIFCIAEILSKTFTDDTNVNVSHGNPLQVKLLWPHYIEHL